MYIVTIQNGAITTEIQNEHHKLFSGSVVKGINTIDSFTFSLLPDNPAFGKLKDFTTLVSVYNLARRRYEFYGRVLYTSPQMSDKGLITQEAICESYLGFLCDSQQEYVEEKNWTVRGLLQYILNCHNAQVEPYKRFQIGQLDVEDPNDNLYLGIQRESTWETIKKKLIDVLGGELRFRVADGVNYLDYVEAIGETKETEIALSKNMKSIVKEKNPSAFITRLIPLGAKLDNDSEERLGIAEVNGGRNYIEDAEAIAEYGVHVGYVEFDDVTEASNLLTKARKWLEDNNKVSVKYSITALDLSLIGLDVDDFEVGNTYPLKNSLLGIDDTGRVNKKTIDVCDETKTSFEIGESFKTLSELQREQMVSVGKLNTDVAEIIRNYATNKRLDSEITRTISLIEQTEDRIKLNVSADYVKSETLTGYVTSDGLNTTLNGYVTGDGLNDTLGGYVTNDGLETILESYATTARIEITERGILQSVSATYAKSSDLASRNLLTGTQELTINLMGGFGLTTPLIKGTTYHFSADVEVLEGSVSAVRLGYTLPDATVKILAPSIPIIDGHVAATFEPEEDVNPDEIFSFFISAFGGDLTSQTKISYAKLEKGDTETGWTLAPEDLLGDYAKTEDVNETLGGYYTKTETDNKISIGLNSIDLSVYAKTEDVNGLVEEISGKLELKIDESALISKINAVANEITITSDNFILTADGSITANNATLKGSFESVDADSSNTVKIENGAVTLENKYSSSITEKIELGGLGIGLKSIVDGTLRTQFKISKIQEMFTGGVYRGIYALTSDGAIVLQAPYGVGVRSATNSATKYLYFNDDGSVTWSTTRPTY